MSNLPHLEPTTAPAPQSSVEVEVHGRARDLGDGFTVRRILPAPTRGMVGPFIFVDHMGPVQMAAGHGLDVRPHPHINLATVTFLFEGEILHRDSLGTEQVIRPGAVNWMTAGRGIVHSERSPLAARKSGAVVHGMQLWVALPRASEEVDPSFQHHAAADIPVVGRPGCRLRIIAGSAYGETSPVKTLSPLFYVEAQLEAGATLELPEAHEERAAYVVAGAIQVEGKSFSEGTLAVFREGGAAKLQSPAISRVLLLGGAPLDGERHLWWNFVSSSVERLEQAKEAWRTGRFPRVPGDEGEFIPLPGG